MNLREILNKHGFYLVESTTQIYSHKTLRPVLSIRRINGKSKNLQFMVSTDKDWDKSEEVIVPYENISEKDKTIIRTEEELKIYYDIRN